LDENVLHLFDMPDTAVLVLHDGRQLLRPSPVLQLRLLLRLMLEHGRAAGHNTQEAAPAAGGDAGSISGPTAVLLPQLAAAAQACLASSASLASTKRGFTAYPVVVVQQAFPRVWGHELPLNFLGVENVKQLIQVSGVSTEWRLLNPASTKVGVQFACQAWRTC
jgi:hypothetical protein